MEIYHLSLLIKKKNNYRQSSSIETEQNPVGKGTALLAGQLAEKSTIPIGHTPGLVCKRFGGTLWREGMLLSEWSFKLWGIFWRLTNFIAKEVVCHNRSETIQLPFI